MNSFINIGLLSSLLLLLLSAGCAPHANKSVHLNSSLTAASAGAPAQSDNQAQSTVDDADEYYEDEYDDLDDQVSDPLEGWNRIMFAFNDATYRFVAKPISKGYDFIVPSPVRTGIKNFFYNLAFPVRFVSNIVQFKGVNAGYEFSQFMVNSTFGIGGLIDVYQRVEPNNPLKDDEDMGQALASKDIGDGFYIVWPLLGPSTARDTLGMIADTFLTPTTYLSHWEARLTANGVRTLNGLSDRLEAYDTMRKNAIEPYSAIRDAYIQFRRGKLER
jgi:phospholipid-binding lipoprotein MlaA